jgi:hypothetical protein
MTAPFRVSAWAMSSAALEVLGEVAGYNRHEALGRWVRAGGECTERQSYVLDEATVRALFGPRGSEALLAAQLAETADGGLRMLKMDGEIEWFADVASKRRRAGQARAAHAQRDERGRLLPSSKPSTPPARAGVLDQHDTSSAPASSSPTPAPTPTLPEQGEQLDLEPPGRSRTRRRPAAPLPDTWNPREVDSTLAGDQLKHELAKFRNHAKAKDRRQVDWDAAWRNWQLTANERAPARSRGSLIGSALASADLPPESKHPVPVGALL